MSVRKLEIGDATLPLAEYARQVDGGEGPVLVTIEGRPVAAVIPVADESDLETISLSTNPKFLEIIERSRARQASEGGISSREMRRRLGVK